MLAFVRDRPYVLIFAAHALGICCGQLLPVPLYLLSASAGLIWLLLAACAAFWWLWRHHASLGLGLGFGALLFLCGWLSVSLQLGAALNSPLLRLQRRLVSTALQQKAEAQREHLLLPKQDSPRAPQMLLSGEVASIPKVQGGYLRLMLHVQRAKAGERWHRADGLCYAFIKLAESTAGSSSSANGGTGDAQPDTALQPATVEIPEVYYRSRVVLNASLSEVEPPLNHGQFNYRGYLKAQGTVLQAFAFSPKALHVHDRHAPQPWAALAGMRRWLIGNLGRGLSAERAALAISVVYGDKITDLSDATMQRFQKAGLPHILVASGTQVSLLIALLGLAFWRLADGATWRGRLINLAQFTLTMAAVLAYATVTGFETSIVRALAMGTLVLLGKLLLREADGLTALAQSGLALLLLNPLNLFSASFQLSFGATFGLIYSYGVFAPLLSAQRPGDSSVAADVTNGGPKSWPPRFALWFKLHSLQSLVSTSGAQLMVIPLLLSTFNQVSLWAFFSNLIAIPLAFLLLAVGGLSSLGIAQVPLLGPAIQWLVSMLALALDSTAQLFALLPGSHVATPSPPLWWSLAYFALLLSLGEWYRRRAAEDPAALHKLRWSALAGLLAVLAGLLYWLCVPRAELAALALPGGEAYLWRPLSGRSMLFVRSAGLGKQHNVDTLASALRWRGINRLHACVWLDSAGSKDPNREALYEALGYKPQSEPGPGDPLQPILDCAWLASNTAQPAGAALQLGSQQLWIAWQPADLPVAHSGGEARPAALAMSCGNWEELRPAQQAVLQAQAAQTLLMDAAQKCAAGDMASAASVQQREVRIVPGGRAVKIRAYTPPLD